MNNQKKSSTEKTKDIPNDKYGFLRKGTFVNRNLIPLLCLISSIITVILSFIYDDNYELRMVIYSCLSVAFITSLIILLFKRERNLKNLHDQNLILTQSKDELVEKNKVLLIEINDKKNQISTFIEKVQTKEYDWGVHALKILNNYPEISLLFRFIKESERKINVRRDSLKRVRNPDKLAKSLEEYTNLKQELTEEICKKIADLLMKLYYTKERTLTVSIFTCHEVGTSPVAMKFCSAFSGSNKHNELHFTDGFSYPISENTDFMDICDKFKLNEHCFFCCGNIPERDYYFDTNHKHLNTGLSHYQKGKQYLLPYRSLISSAIFDVNVRSSNPKNINGFLSVSSPSVDCFTRSDTLLLQVISAQLHDLCIKLNTKT